MDVGEKAAIITKSALAGNVEWMAFAGQIDKISDSIYTEFMISYAYFHSPIGFIELSSDGKALISVRFVEAPVYAHSPDLVLDQAIRQLTGYFSGGLRIFDVPLKYDGSDFQLAVWEQLRRIPFGTTRTYGDIARMLGAPSSARAVGAAVGANPILLIVPCHRVIGSAGKLGGYAGGLWRKVWLLRHESELTY